MSDTPSQDADQRLAERAGRMLRQSTEGLDAASQSRLNRARQAALAEFDRKAAAPGWLPAGRWYAGIAVAAVAAVAIAIGITRAPLRIPESPAQSEHVAEVEVLLADESLEMIDDLDFYDWLAPEESPVTSGFAPPMAG